MGGISEVGTDGGGLSPRSEEGWETDGSWDLARLHFPYGEPPEDESFDFDKYGKGVATSTALGQGRLLASFKAGKSAAWATAWAPIPGARPAAPAVGCLVGIATAVGWNVAANQAIEGSSESFKAGYRQAGKASMVLSGLEAAHHALPEGWGHAAWEGGCDAGSDYAKDVAAEHVGEHFFGGGEHPPGGHWTQEGFEDNPWYR